MGGATQPTHNHRQAGEKERWQMRYAICANGRRPLAEFKFFVFRGTGSASGTRICDVRRNTLTCEGSTASTP